MGSSKKITVSHWYKLIMHLGWCKGPIDALLEMRGGDRVAWRGRMDHSGDIYVDQPNLYGGESSEGGIQGTFEVMMGEPDQMPNAYLAQEFGEAQPGYRGRATILLKGPKIGAGNPYPKPLYFKLERLFKGWDNDEPWYPEKLSVKVATINAADRPWRYLVVSNSDAVDRSSPSFDDSSWSVGRPPFADKPWTVPTQYGFSGTPATVVPQARKVWMRTTIPFSPVPTTMRFQAFVDNDCSLYVNGVHVITVGGNNGAYYDQAISTAAFVEGDNHIAVVGWDRHSGSGNWFWFDWRVVSDLDQHGMNPAHILYDSITSRRENGGMEEPAGRINEASFRAAADRLHSEGFGLCCTWHGGESAEQFQQRIINVIGGSLSQSRVDGQYYLDLLREVDDVDALPTLTDDDIIEWAAEPALPTESVNQVQVKWFDPSTREERITPPVQSLGAIEDAGGVLADTREYYEVPYESLALRLAQRDLQSLSSALWRFTLTCTRRPFDLRPGMQVRLMCPKRGFADIVVVIGEIDYGDFGNDEISLVAIQDVFSLPSSVYVDPQESLAPPSSATPAPISERIVIEAPYVELASALSSGDLAALDESAGYIMTGARRPANGNDYALATRVGAEDYESYGNMDWTPSLRIVDADILLDGPPQTEFAFAAGQMLDRVEVGTWALWGAEIVRVDGLDASAGTVTFGRACADTVPHEHDADSIVYFIGDWYGADGREYAEGETVYAKMMNRTSSAQIDIAVAPEDSALVGGRQSRPYPPGNVQVDGEYYPLSVLGFPSVTWAHRDRVLQADQLVDFFAGDVGPEAGVTYTVENYNDVSNELVFSEDGITGASCEVSALASKNRVELFSVRDGVESWQRHIIRFDAGFELLTQQFIGGASNETLTIGLLADGAAAPVTWSIVSGTLPAGVTLGTSTTTENSISGVPPYGSEGYYTVTVRAEPDGGAGIERTIVIGVGKVVIYNAFDGADNAQDTVARDRSGKPWDLSGNVKTVSDAAALGGSEGAFDGNGDYLTTNVNNAYGDFALGTSDFTFEFFFTPFSIPASGYWEAILSQRRTSSSQFAFSFEHTSTLPAGRVTGAISSSGSQSSGTYSLASPVAPVGVRQHYAFSRRGDRFYLHVDGVLSDAVDLPVGYSVYNSSQPVRIGAFDQGPWANSYLDGKLDEFRFVKGAAKYAEADTFNPPLTASDFPAVKTGALLHFDGADGSTVFTDEAGNAWSRVGTAAISTAQSRFGGSSVFFPSGAGNYLTHTTTADTLRKMGADLGDYTIEFWTYVIAPASGAGCFFDFRGGSEGSRPCLYMNSGTLIPRVYLQGADRIVAANALTLNQWHHIAVCRKSGVVRLFVDGVQEGSDYSNPVMYNIGPSVLLNRSSYGNTSHIPMYMDEFRVLKDLGLYDSNFTPPSAPFTYPE